MKVSLEKPPLNELAHYGILGMRWGVRRDQRTLDRLAGRRPTYYDRSKANYLKKGYTEKDASRLAERKVKVRRAALVAGGVAVVAGTAFAYRHYSIENKDFAIKAGNKAWHITRDELKPLEEGRHLYVSANAPDRLAYRWRLANPENVARVERTFQAMEDIKIPSPVKSEKMFDAFAKNPEVKNLLSEAASKYNQSNAEHIMQEMVKLQGDTLDTRMQAVWVAKMQEVKLDTFKQFGIYAPYFSSGDSWHQTAGDNAAGEKLWKMYKDYVVKAGYQGLLDVNDRNPAGGFNVERPTIIFNAASKLKEVSQKTIADPTTRTALIPTIREISSLSTLKGVGLVGAVAALGTKSKTVTLESYRYLNPDSKLTDKQIMKKFRGKDQELMEMITKAQGLQKK